MASPKLPDLNSSKITDFFPTNKTAEEKKDDDVSKLGITNNDDGALNHDLSTSSVLITPTLTPEKNSDDDQTGHTSHKHENPACKKGLTEKLNKEIDNHEKSINETSADIKKKESSLETPRPKSRRRGRRKKMAANKSEQINVSSANTQAKPKTVRKKQTEPDNLKNTLVTDYFAVRRSDRKSKIEIEKQKEEDLVSKILNCCEEGLKVVEFDNKGRGVIATKAFGRGDFVVEYAGDLIDLNAAKEREERYAIDPTKGCYMYYFHFLNKKYCIDATEESGKLGRLLNHSKTKGNCHTKLVDVKGDPYLILVASRDITEGEELLYDYGDRSKAALESHPWLKA
ncbi:N-lysine methyltransferase KMT5A-like [Dreissena polymorpha]|uniref:[histone H4]-lysine(20) N-methyltransferase n=1 Tax=Dreissena polymorpha TaxID=45954 RepID=A0A9D4RS43_DREPO|nr:N-lysine methyltransferase KMT5A-like [Dreissena polymorpha]KAH3876898.1 hypothetical protein DPMN_000750 [Dreissena polymorpha]